MSPAFAMLTHVSAFWFALLQTLKDAAAARNEIVFHTDGLPPMTAEMTDEEIREQMINGEQPSEAALSKFTAHCQSPRPAPFEHPADSDSFPPLSGRSG